MKVRLIRYETRPEAAEENEALIRAVFAELHEKAPDGFRYTAVKLDDTKFVHLVATETGESAAFDISQLESFKRFQKGIRERTVDAPVARDVSVVGSYRMLKDG